MGCSCSKSSQRTASVRQPSRPRQTRVVNTKNDDRSRVLRRILDRY